MRSEEWWRRAALNCSYTANYICQDSLLYSSPILASEPLLSCSKNMAQQKVMILLISAE